MTSRRCSTTLEILDGDPRFRHFMLDGQLVTHSVTFQRYDPGFDPANLPTTPAQAVSNSGGPFPLPMVGVGLS